MTTIRAVLLFVLTVGALITATPAEVAVGEDGFQFLMTAGPRASAPGDDDPFIWPVVRQALYTTRPELFLNPEGVTLGDEWPAFAIDPRNNQPVVVWARLLMGQRDIVFARWDGASWTPPERLTMVELNDRRPAVAFDAQGDMHFAWWRLGNGSGVDRLMYFKIPAVGLATGEEPVDLGGRAPDVRPSIAVFRGEVWIAFEELTNQGIVDLKVARKVGSRWRSEKIGSTTYAGPYLDGDLRVELHSTPDRLWADWVDAYGLMAYSQWEWQTPGAAWTPPSYDQYLLNAFPGDSEVLAQESGRARIRLQVIRR